MPGVLAVTLMRPIRRPLGAFALLLLWINLEVQAQRALPDLDPRLLAARLILCYVAVFWLCLAWSALATRRARAAPTTAPTPPPAPASAPPPRPSGGAQSGRGEKS